MDKNMPFALQLAATRNQMCATHFLLTRQSSVGQQEGPDTRQVHKGSNSPDCLCLERAPTRPSSQAGAAAACCLPAHACVPCRECGGRASAQRELTGGRRKN